MLSPLTTSQEVQNMSSTGCADSAPVFDVVRFKIADNIKALVGGGQSAKTLDPLTSFHRVTTVTSAGDSVTLPKAQPGPLLMVVNAAAANSMNVYPFLGDAINALGANAAFAVAAGKVAIFLCTGLGQYHSLLTA